MKAMKRLVAVAVAFAGLGAGTAFANYPVIDVANLTESIEQVYQTYMDIQQAIQTVQNQYIQIKHAIEAVKNFDYSQFKALGDPEAWENPETIRNAYKATLTAANRYANQIKNVKNKVYGDHIRIGGMKISAADLLGVSGDTKENGFQAGKSALKILKERAQVIGKAYTGQLTWEERKAIMDKYGMSAENYAETQVAEEIVEGTVRQIANKIKEAKEQDSAGAESGANGMTEKAQESAPESTVMRQDLMNTLLAKSARIAEDTKNAIVSVGEDVGEQLRNMKNTEDAETKKKRTEEAKAARKAARDANYHSFNWDW